MKQLTASTQAISQFANAQSRILIIPVVLLALAWPDRGLSEPKWDVVPSAKTKILLDIPEVSQLHRANLEQKDPGHRFRLEQSYWVLNSEPIVVIVFHDLSSDRHFTGEWNYTSISEWEFFKNRTISFSEKKIISNAIGGADYWMTRADDYHCITFRQYWGQQSGDVGNAIGTKALFGHYCNPEGKGLSGNDAKRVLKAIGVIGHGVPTQSD